MFQRAWSKVDEYVAACRSGLHGFLSKPEGMNQAREISQNDQCRIRIEMLEEGVW